MAIQNKPKRWLNKPPLGVQINWGHPLANGLLACYLLNEGAGTIANNLATKGNGILQSASGSGPWTNDRIGPTISIPSTNNWFQESVATAALPISVVTIVSFSALGARAYFGSHEDAGETHGWYLFKGGTDTFCWGSLTSGENIGTLTFTITNAYYFTAITAPVATNFTFYIGLLGQPINSQNISATTIAGTLTKFNVGHGNAITGASLNIAMMLYYNRGLTLGELNWLNIEPYAFMRPMSPAIRQNFASAVVKTMVPGIFQNPVDPLSIVTV